MQESTVKVGFRITKTLRKRLKQFGLDNDKSFTEVAIEAFEEYLKKHRRRR